MNKKILYIGCHGYLEYDDIKILSHAGFSVFSTGGWSDPLQPVSAVRPPIPSARQVPGALDLWNRDKLTPQSCVQSAAFLDLFDVILVVHDHSIVETIPADNKKPVIFRTIGQSSPPLERWMSQHRDRIKIVRYSPNESNIPGYAGADALIRFGKFEEDFPVWSGHEKTVLSFYQQATRRLAHANFEFYEQATAPFPRVLYGNGNPPSEFSRPTATYDDMQRYYSAHRVYYSLGTYPASYTLNFMEAMMVGIPLVTLGHSAASSPYTKPRLGGIAYIG